MPRFSGIRVKSSPLSINVDYCINTSIIRQQDKLESIKSIGSLLDGYYINLKSSIDRRQYMEDILQQLQLETMYHRFEAIRPKDPDSFKLKNLKSTGEEGLWLSLLELFRCIEDDAQNKPFIHIIEDDIEISEDYFSVIPELLTNWQQDPSWKNIDIIFLYSFKNMQLFKGAVKLYEENCDQYKIIDGKYYLASTSSFIIKKSTVPLLRSILSSMYQSGKPIPPIDIMFRRLIKLNFIDAKIMTPSLCRPKMEIQINSTINETYDDIFKSKVLYLLLNSALYRDADLVSIINQINTLTNNTQMNVSGDVSLNDLIAVWNTIKGQLTKF